MSKLEELIQKYCPDGVEFALIGDIAQVGTGSSNGNEAEEDGTYPFFIRSQTIKRKNDYEYDEEAIIIPGEGGIGDIFHYINGKYALHQRVYRIHFTVPSVNVKFAYYYMGSAFKQFIMKKAVSATVTSIRKPMIEGFEIPIPPLPAQEEIVRVLDTFTELQEELQAELQKREQQYDYYQDLLLNRSKFSHLVSIGDMCEIKKGNTPIQKAKEGVYPLVVTTMERRSSDTYQFNANAVCIPLISSRGHGVASLNHVYYQEGKFALGNILCAVIPHDENILKAKFLYYYLEYAKDYTLVPLMKGGANVSMHCSDIEKVKIPLPSLDEQERIISILDRFDALTNDLSTGLPAEIEKRKQQYEYYRDKLLTFKRKEA